MDGGSCNAASCPNGCCAGGVCQQSSVNSCGTGGSACSVCTGNQTCTAGACVDPACEGCINGAGNCVPPSQQTAAQCGASGTSCVGCASGQACVNGICQGSATCSPQTCSGCCNSAGQCVGGGSTTACGIGGNTCVSCPSGQSCNGGACQSTTTGSLGAPCTTNSQCAGLGSGAICRMTTSSGNATYSGGYCTRECTAHADCGTGYCAGFGNYGEDPLLCYNSCIPSDTQNPCRSGYACYDIGQSGTPMNLCWISPPPSVTTPVGLACSTHPDCQNGGSFPAGGCIPALNPDGGSSGWTDGYCTAECSQDPALCGGNAICLGFSASDSFCMDKCAAPNAGRSDCRTGYVCQGYLLSLSDGGTMPSTDGFCYPSCQNRGCPQGSSCSSSGYCT